MEVGDYRKLPLKEFASVQDRETSEARFWKAFNVVKEHQFQSAPNTIHFNPTEPQSYIVTATTKVSLFDGLSDKVLRAYSRFQDDAFSGKFRKDGKLIIAGDKTGTVKVFDYQTKALLRQLRRHNAAVRTVSWSSDGLNIISGSDDKKVLKWDLATEEVLWSSRSHHSDYVRASDGHPITPDIFASASYDHTVTLWDSRQSDAVWSVNHGHPIDYCMFTPSGSILITAGGSEVKLWDVVNSGRLVHTFNNHQKNVTSLAIDGTTSRLLSGGLDGHVKIYSLQTLQVAHGMKFQAPIVSLGISQDNKKLAIGFVNGELMVRNNRKEKARTSSDALRPEISSSATLFEIMDQQLSQSRYHKGAGNVHDFENTVVVETERAAHLQPYEKHLKKFNYQKALDAALATRNPVVVITILEELCRRNGLTIALSGRDELSLEPLLSFVTRYVNHARYSKLVGQVAHRILDIYASVLGYSETIDELFSKLQRQVESEVAFQKEIMKVKNSIDCIINVATMPKRLRTEDALVKKEENTTLEVPVDLREP